MSLRVVTYKKKDLKKYQWDKTIEKVIIDDEVTEIAAEAFLGCTKLKVIVFGPNCKVKKIGHGAFCQCALEEVDFPNSLEEIKGKRNSTGAFAACANLQKMSFGSNLKIVGGAAFYQCTKLEAIVLKEKVTTIGEKAFTRCSNLSTFVWPKSVTTVGDEVFDDCAKLHELAGSDKQDDVIAYPKKTTTPLVKLCINNGELEEIKQIVEEDPDAPKQTHGDSRTPLSYYCENGSSEEVLKLLLEQNPEAAKEKNDDNYTSLHYLGGNSSITDEMLKCVLEVYPEAAKEKNNAKNTPLSPSPSSS